MQSKPKASSTGSIIAILGVVALIVGLILMLVLPETGIGAWGVLGVGIVLLIVAVVIDFSQVRKAISGRHGRFGLGSGVMSIIFIGITIFVNAISIGQYYRVDTSALEQFTLTPQTIKVLQNMDSPVKIIAFFTSEKDTYGINDYVYSLITVYENYSKRLTFSIVDPDQHPDVAKDYGISEYQTIAFESGDRRRLVAPSQFITTDENGDIASLHAEHAFTSAILEVTGVAQKHIYFLTGHGEGDIATKFSDARDGLLDDLYKVDTLNLTTNPSIPGDCAALIIVAPQNAFTTEEVVLIQTYLLSGGACMILTNPNGIDDIQTIVSWWGVDIGDGTIIDPSSSMAPHQDTPVVPYSRNYFYLSQVYFPGAVAIIPQATDDSSVITVNPMVVTTASAWMDKNFSADTDPVFDSATEKMEMLYIGALIAAPSLTSTDRYIRLAVIGDSDFASNDNYVNGNNGDLFLNTVNWLAEETSLISIHRNVQPFRRLVLNQSQTNFIQYSSIGLIPFLMVVIAGVIWWRRR